VTGALELIHIRQKQKIALKIAVKVASVNERAFNSIQIASPSSTDSSQTIFEHNARISCINESCRKLPSHASLRFRVFRSNNKENLD
jgi:hypothetical protein